MKAYTLRTVAVGFAAFALVACNSDRLTVPNYQNPTPEEIRKDPVAAVPLLVTGLLQTDRQNHIGFVSGVGILGRESYNYTLTEGRNTTGWLTPDVRNSTSFGGVALWTGYYQQLRQVDQLLDLVAATPDGIISPARKSAIVGFARTMEAQALADIIAVRDTLGAVVEVLDDPTQLAPFVSRDSVYRRIVATLDTAKTALLAAGTTAFPFTLAAGYTGFTTPATFLRVNRAIAARVNAWRASLGTGGCTVRSATCYQLVLTNLAESFLTDTAGASLTTGVYRTYSAAANEQANTLSNQATSNIVAHYLTDAGIQTRPTGARDSRYTSKVITLAAPRGAGNDQIGRPTTFDYSIYLTRESRISLIRNEELILLRAEARYFTGDLVGALADINFIRTTAGGLAARGPFLDANDFITELLYNRRLSLLFEGHRWIDVRRFGRLNTLPLDLANHIVINNLPIPQGECLARSLAAASLRAPGC